MPPAGLYLHIPFCAARCAYCDFYSLPVGPSSASGAGIGSGADWRIRYPELLKSHMRQFAGADAIRLPGLPRSLSAAAFSRFDTLYLGGGTPTVLPPETLADLISTALDLFPFVPGSDGIEITMEANPGTLSGADLTLLKSAGVTRLNFGVQSFSDAALALLGRIHTACEAVDIIRAARDAGFDNLGLDLIYGLPGQTEEEWDADLNAALARAPEHLSCYLLTYEPGTPLSRKAAAGALTPLSDDGCGDLLRHTRRRLHSSGYAGYEVSSFALRAGRKDFRSRHNRKYWTGAPYLGLGPAAHSFLPPDTRFHQAPDLAEYAKRIQAGDSPVTEVEALTAEQRFIEGVCLGLRRAEGIAPEELPGLSGEKARAVFKNRLRNLEIQGFLERTEGRWHLTESGWPVMDGVIRRLI
ncbi:MAG: hypothetical protein CSB33_00550 [Desulfobacterales bacterium]|nr:MAG: hypothetical protein CSB33_00550 [Desulfobacterales bacterium]